MFGIKRVTWKDLRNELLAMYKDARKAEIKFEVSPFYFTVTNKHKTWYWNKETGEFDGTSWDMTDANP